MEQGGGELETQTYQFSEGECAGGVDRRQGHLRVTYLWETERGRRATKKMGLQRSRSKQDGL